MTYDVKQTQRTSLFTFSDDSYDNRIFRCLMIFSVDWAIHRFEKISELLNALRDVVKAHKFLYFKENILHRDIFKNNITIIDFKRTDDVMSMLIDLNLVKKLNSDSSDARRRIDTMKFMTIEMLLEISHIYQHDLESFFYVLIWQCDRHEWRFSVNSKNQSKDSLLTKWYIDTFKDIASIKRSDMNASEFEDILKKFSPQFDCVKSLCRELRKIFFQYMRMISLLRHSWISKRCMSQSFKCFTRLQIISRRQKHNSIEITSVTFLSLSDLLISTTRMKISDQI